VVGPATGAVLVGILGYASVFFINGITFFFSALMILRIHLVETLIAKGGIKEMVNQMKEGLVLIKKTRPVLFVVSLYSGIMLLFGGINVLFFVFVRDILHLDIIHLGLIDGFQGGGMILGAVAVGAIGATYQKRSLMLVGTFFVGVFLALFGANPYIIVSYVLILFFGISVMFLNIPASTLLQEVVPDEIRGRIFGVQGTLVQTFSILSIGWESAVAAIVGAQTVIIIVGVLCACVGVLGRFFPDFES
jgi:MFS family permease